MGCVIEQEVMNICQVELEDIHSAKIVAFSFHLQILPDSNSCICYVQQIISSPFYVIGSITVLYNHVSFLNEIQLIYMQLTYNLHINEVSYISILLIIMCQNIDIEVLFVQSTDLVLKQFYEVFLDVIFPQFCQHIYRCDICEQQYHMTGF